jgi:hypothetical protein
LGVETSLSPLLVAAEASSSRTNLPSTMAAKESLSEDASCQLGTEQDEGGEMISDLSVKNDLSVKKRAKKRAKRHRRRKARARDSTVDCSTVRLVGTECTSGATRGLQDVGAIGIAHLNPGVHTVVEEERKCCASSTTRRDNVDVGDEGGMGPSVYMVQAWTPLDLSSVSSIGSNDYDSGLDVSQHSEISERDYQCHGDHGVCPCSHCHDPTLSPGFDPVSPAYDDAPAEIDMSL